MAQFGKQPGRASPHARNGKRGKRGGKSGGKSGTSSMELPGLRQIGLDNLTEREGVQLLKQLGVTKKSSQPLPQTVKALHGHALSLVLLAGLLVRRGPQWQQGMAVMDRRNLWAPAAMGEHVPRILAYYDKNIWSKESAHGLCLRLFSLFDGPMQEADFQILLADTELAKPLQSMDSVALMAMFADLHQAGLLLSSGQQRCWYGHALVQRWFRQKWQAEEEMAQQERHASGSTAVAKLQSGAVPSRRDGLSQARRVLSDYFQVMTQERLPDSRVAMESLYRAVEYGCQAGVYQEVLSKVFQGRIHRGSACYSQTQLGAYGSDLTALAGFYPQGWSAPPIAAGLSEQEHVWLLSQAVRCLVSLGRIPEAMQVQEEHLRLETQRAVQQAVVESAVVLCDLQLLCGKLKHALAIAEHGLRWAERGDILPLQWLLKGKRATILHRLGKWSESQTLYQAMEMQQRDQTPDQPWLMAGEGFAYASLLLEQEGVNVADILDRVKAIVQQAVADKNRRWMASGLLVQGRVLSIMGEGDKAHEALNGAMDALDEGKHLPIIAEIRLQRATLMRRLREPDAARQELQEGLSLALRCGLALLEVDGKLLEGHILLDEHRRTEAEQALVHAETLITQMEYGQRRPAAMALRTRWS